MDQLTCSLITKQYITNASIPDSQLKKKHHRISYHMSQESVNSGACHIVKEDTDTNLANLCTKVLTRVQR